MPRGGRAPSHMLAKGMKRITTPLRVEYRQMTPSASNVSTKSQDLLLNTFHIEGFRGLRDLHLEELSRVNILVGSNNAGKTSILEAMALYGAAVDMAEWSSIARLREGRAPSMFADPLSSIEAIRWMFPHGDADAFEPASHDPINLYATGRTLVERLSAACTHVRGVPPEPPRGLRARHPVDDAGDDFGWSFNVQREVKKATLFDGEENFEFTLWASQGIHSSDRVRQSKAFRYELLPPYGHRNQPNNLRKMSESTRLGTLPKVEELIRELDSDILGLDILTTADGRRPLIVVNHRTSGTVPLNVLGDGVRRAVSLALAIHDAKDGLLLIDEIEAALHVSALNKVYPWLVRMCEQLNVQIFATTHSLEAIDSIAELVDANDHGRLTAFQVDDRHDKNVRRYTGGMLRRLVHEQGLDVR